MFPCVNRPSCIFQFDIGQMIDSSSQNEACYIDLWLEIVGKSDCFKVASFGKILSNVTRGIGRDLSRGGGGGSF